jgi:hypothetical protein
MAAATSPERRVVFAQRGFVMVSSSNTPMAHPPRSNPFLRSSSDAPPFPCITPSTVTCVMVVSFMGSSFLSWWSFSL